MASKNGDQLYVERRPQGDYAVRRPGRSAPARSSQPNGRRSSGEADRTQLDADGRTGSQHQRRAPGQMAQPLTALLGK